MKLCILEGFAKAHCCCWEEPNIQPSKCDPALCSAAAAAALQMKLRSVSVLRTGRPWLLLYKLYCED